MKEDIPKKFDPIADFINDRESIEVCITCVFFSSAVVDQLSFESDNYKASVVQKGSLLYLNIFRSIPKSLFEKLYQECRGEFFILGYIDNVLKKFDELLMWERYSKGHLLVDSYSIHDIRTIVIKNLIDGRQTEIEWPRPILPFPGCLENKLEHQEWYINDYVDAMSYYLNNSFDGCIRKVITSIENYFSRYSIAAIIKKEEPLEIINFNSKLERSVDGRYYLPQWNDYLSIWIGNIKILYEIRNKTLHANTRLDFMDNWVCKKGIVSLSYIYQSSLIDMDVRKYIFALIMQFQMLDHRSRGIDLDFITKSGLSSNIVENSSDLDKWVFDGLKIDDQEKDYLKKKYRIRIS